MSGELMAAISIMPHDARLCYISSAKTRDERSARVRGRAGSRTGLRQPGMRCMAAARPRVPARVVSRWFPGGFEVVPLGIAPSPNDFRRALPRRAGWPAGVQGGRERPSPDHLTESRGNISRNTAQHEVALEDQSEIADGK
jgi:hypothetical protein